MTDAKEKQRIIKVVGYCGGGALVLIGVLVGSGIKGGIVLGVLGYFIFSGLTTLVLHFMKL